MVLAQLQDIATSWLARTESLATPFLLRIDERCQVTGFARARATRKVFARTQQALMHELLFTWPARADASAGPDSSVSETIFAGQDGAGEFVAAITTLDDAEGTLVQRRVDRYSKFWNDRSGARPWRRTHKLRPHNRRQVV